METVTVTLGGKEYRANRFTVPESCELLRIVPALQAATREVDVPKSTALLREMLEIVCSSIRRTGSNVPIDEVMKEWPDAPAAEIFEAAQTILDISGGEFPTRVNLDPGVNLN